MEYLERTGLERIVSEALVATINDRAPNPTHTMAERLAKAAGAAGASVSSQAHKDEVAARMAAEELVVQREAELKDLQGKFDKLQKENEVNKGKIVELKAKGDKLEKWLREFEPGSASTDAKPAPALTPEEAAKKDKEAAEATANGLRDINGKLYDKLLAGDGSGLLGTARLQDFAKALENGCAASPNPKEKEAMGAYLKVLEAMLAAAPSYNRKQWLAFQPAESAYGPGQRELVLTVLSAILSNDSAVEGLLEAVEADSASNRSFVGIMGRLHDFVVASADGHAATRARMRALIRALRAGCESPDADPREQRGMRAFLRVLERMADAKEKYTRAEWVSYTPPAGSFTPDEKEAYFDMLTAILGNHDAVRGLSGMLDER